MSWSFAMPRRPGFTPDEDDRSWICQWSGLRFRSSTTARRWILPMQDGFIRFHVIEISRGAAESAEREACYASLTVGNPAPSRDLPCLHGGCPFSASSAARRALPSFWTSWNRLRPGLSALRPGGLISLGSEASGPSNERQPARRVALWTLSVDAPRR